MKRREFSLAAAGLATGLPLLVRAQAKMPEDGREYRTLDRRVPVDAPAEKVEVVDFFWYSCPHCNAFEPMLQAWNQRLPADVTLHPGDSVAFRVRAFDDKGIPLLSKIPILGIAFGAQTFSRERTELVLVITPKIVSDPYQARAATDELREKLPALKGLMPKTKQGPPEGMPPPGEVGK